MLIVSGYIITAIVSVTIGFIAGLIYVGDGDEGHDEDIPW